MDNSKRMKKQLPALLLLALFAFAGCKKDSAPGKTTKSADTVVNTQPTISVSAISPTNVTEGTAATISGTNLSGSGLTVFFEGVQATVQSVSATEIKVSVPKTSSGNITFKINNQTVLPSTTLSFAYYDSPLVKVYDSGDVTLLSQADVDAFVKVNRGKSFQITGNLNIGPGGFTQLSDISTLDGLSNMITGVTGVITINEVAIDSAPFLKTITTAGGLTYTNSSVSSLELGSLQNFSGNINLSGLANLSSLKLNALTKIGDITISGATKLSDLSTLSTIQTAGSITINSVGATALQMDHLSSMNSLSLAFDAKLSTVSFKALTTMNGSLYAQFCQQLTSLDFTSVTTISGRLYIFLSGITDMSGFKNLQSLGALYLRQNTVLSNVQDLRHLTTLTLPAINGSAHLAAGPYSFGLGVEAVLGGVTIESNAGLTSLAGLENITTIPVAYIYNNKSLNDFCPFKASINTLSSLPAYSYTLIDDPAGMTYQRNLPAVTLIVNSNYITTQDALATVAECK